MSQDYPPTLAGVRAAGEQISALQAQVERLTAQVSELDKSNQRWIGEALTLKRENDALRKALDTIPWSLMLAGGPPYSCIFTPGALRQIAEAAKGEALDAARKE